MGNRGDDEQKTHKMTNAATGEDLFLDRLERSLNSEFRLAWCSWQRRMVDIKKLLEYNEAVRHRYFETFTKLSWEAFTKDREASFHSLRSIFVHTLSAIDYWLDFLQKQNLHSDKNYDEYETLEQVKAYMEHVEKRTHAYLNQLTQEELEKTYTVKGDDGKTHNITAEDVLIHVFEEEVHHRGEFIALLWQMGIEPPPMGWKEL